MPGTSVQVKPLPGGPRPLPVDKLAACLPPGGAVPGTHTIITRSGLKPRGKTRLRARGALSKPEPASDININTLAAIPSSHSSSQHPRRIPLPSMLLRQALASFCHRCPVRSSFKQQITHRGARTHDHKVKGLALCQLSWAGCCLLHDHKTCQHRGALK